MYKLVFMCEKDCDKCVLVPQCDIAYNDIIKMTLIRVKVNKKKTEKIHKGR